MPKVAVHRIMWPSRQAFASEVTAAFERCGLSHGSALILTAHAALSSGWGGEAHGGLPNYSLCGIKVPEASAASVPYVELRGFEEVNGQRVYSMMKWRAYDSLDAGALGVLNVLRKTRRSDGTLRYQSALAMLLAGDTGYFRQVGLDGWYSAKPDETAADMLSRYRRIVAWEQASQAGFVSVALAAAMAVATYFFL